MRLDLTLVPTDYTACCLCGDPKTLREVHTIAGMGRVCVPCIRAEAAQTAKQATR